MPDFQHSRYLAKYGRVDWGVTIQRDVHFLPIFPFTPHITTGGKYRFTCSTTGFSLNRAPLEPFTWIAAESPAFIALPDAFNRLCSPFCYTRDTPGGPPADDTRDNPRPADAATRDIPCSLMALMTRDTPGKPPSVSSMLLAAIDHAFVQRERGQDGMEWLDRWRNGEAAAMYELTDWMALNVR